MASRWKRFAFFDRRNLPLPPAVAKDLIPSTSGSTGGSQRQQRGSDGGRANRGGVITNDALDPQNLYPEETSVEDCMKIGHGEYFSLVAAENVSLPQSIFAGEHGAIKRGAGGDGAPAMHAGLMAMKSSKSQNKDPSLKQSANDSQKSSGNATTVSNEGGGNGELILLFASSRNTCLVHCIDVTVRCTPENHLENHQFADGTGSSAPGNNNSGGGGRDAFVSASSSNISEANPEDMDGWRGHYNPFSEADGFLSTSGLSSSSVTGKDGTPNAPTPNPSLSKSSSASKGAPRGRNAAEQRILDEHLGGGTNDYDTGGSLFASSPFASPMDPGSSSNVPRARIVGLATCGTVGTKPTKNAKSNNSTLYVASITDTANTVGLVVHANPHLILSSQPPTSSPPTKSRNVNSHYYKPSGAFNFNTQGKPTCVTILPGVVCVGTDKGTVSIYTFDYLIAPSSERGGRLTLVAEIPAPRSSGMGAGTGSDGEKSKTETSLYSVSSVELIGPSPMSNDGKGGSSWSTQQKQIGIHRLFVSYRRRAQLSGGSGANTTGGTGTATQSSSSGPSGGVSCYDLGGIRIPGKPLPPGLSANSPVVSSRYDMDGRDVGTSCLCDVVGLPPMPPSLWLSNNDASTTTASSTTRNDSSGKEQAEESAVSNMEKMLPRYTVARGDGLHLYSSTEKVGVCPVDGNKIAICSLPPPPAVYLRRPLRPPSSSGAVANGDDVPVSGAGATYALVATTDSKSGRDAVDIYDTSNRLVGFHVLLSPGHRALRSVGIASSPTVGGGRLIRGGRSSAVVLTSGGSIVTLTEKVTPEKVGLLIQKNLFSAAISMAFSDPAFYRPEDITALYRRYAEHLYRKGDFAAAMDQYILTIGSLESAHVIFRFLDSQKIPLLVKYLEALRCQGFSTSAHNELLKTCYLKLGDPDSAGKIVLSASNTDGSSSLQPDGSELPTVSISRNLLACADDPSEMLAAICSLEAPETVEALVAHGPVLARSLPRETAGVVIALCDGTYSPTALADAAAGRPATRNNGASQKDVENGFVCEKYPISLFAHSFMENPKLLRLILSHCRRNDCVLSSVLQRTLLELTLDEWNAAKRSGDGDLEKLRHGEAITLLSENNDDDYERLVIVQAADFEDGEILLLEKLSMNSMLLEKYASNGGERARRQMLSMCDHDPELFPEVLSHLVHIAGERSNKGGVNEDASFSSDTDLGGVFRDIHEALVMAREHVDLPPVRVLRILAGEGFGQFSSDSHAPTQNRCSVPLAVALDYVGAILDDSSRKIHRLKSNVEEYNSLCNDMEREIDALISQSSSKGSSGEGNKGSLPDIDKMYTSLQESADGKSDQLMTTDSATGFGRQGSEEFWREIENCDDAFETICFYISKGYLENI